MKVLADPTWGVDNKEFYVDIDKKLTNRWCKLFVELNRLVVRTNKIESSKANWAISSTLGEFLNVVFHYHGFLQEILCRNVDLFRSIGDDEDVVGFANTAENHPLFNPRQLDQWLNFKSAELEMFHSMVCRIGMGILFCGLFKLGEQPTMPRKKYSLVLYVPPLDDFTHAALKAMQKFAYDPYRYFSLKKEKSTDCRQPWHTIQRRREIVLDKIDELVRYVERNKDILNNVNFIVCQSKNRNVLQCNYYVFDNENLATYQLHRLPDPPTGLRIYRQVNRNRKRAKMCSFSIRVEWDYEELGVPCTFLLQYRLKGSFNSWNQQRTFTPGQTHLNIHFEIASTWEIRVAAETCVGLGEFSQIVQTELAFFEEEEVENPLPLSPPRKQQNICLQPQTDVKVKSVTCNSVELEWSFLPGFGNKFRVDYWEEGEDDANARCKFQDQSPCLLENLEANTTYFATVSSGDESN